MDEIKEIARLIQKSRYTVVLTGAGMSTESGIPDFRSSGGIYDKLPEDIFSISYFRQYPGLFYESFLKNLYVNKDVKPNIGHVILADWEERKLVHEIITQNVDSLHTRADSKMVTEIHSSNRTATCLRCGKAYDFDKLAARGGEFYYCSCINEKTDNLIKPDVVLYGESVPLYREALQAVRDADLLFVLGSSLVVYPVAGLVNHAPAHTDIVIINKTETSFDSGANVRAVHKPIGETLKAIDEVLEDFRR